MFVDFGIPTLHDLAAQSTMRYYQKYSSPQIHNQSIIQQIVATNTLYSGTPIDTVHPSITRMLQDAHFDSIIVPNTLIQQHKWTTVGARARFIISPAIDAQMNQLKSIPHVATIQVVTTYQPHPHNIPPTQLNDTPSLTHKDLSSITHLSTFNQWREQWKSRSPAHDRATTAPLVEVKRLPQTTPILHCIDDKLAIRTLLRLRHGRAFTHDIRARFPSAAIQSQSQSQQPPLNHFCKFPLCETNSVIDSVKHLLLDCPSQDTHRQTLFMEWKTHRYGRTLTSTASLRLHMLLGEPPGTYQHKYRNKYVQWYKPLVKFINSVYKNLPVTDQYPKPL
jgi:hypothetical protein